MPEPIKVLLLDIGGVLLTDGWETQSREKAAIHFSLDVNELNQRHRNVFDAYESGKMSLDEYLELIVFYQQRPFSADEFKNFMFAESKPLNDMLRFMKAFKSQSTIPIVAVNNEPKEINEYRIHQYGLDKIIDVFVSSCYVNIRKPDKKIYQIALNLLQATPEQAVYIDDHKVYTELATRMGINAIHHTSVSETERRLNTLGLYSQILS